MKHLDDQWLLFVVSLPTPGASARMRIWRTLKTLGCGSLRDGAYLLPYSEAHAETFSRLTEEVAKEGGTSWILAVKPAPANQNEAFRTLFNREAEYSAFLQVVTQTRATLSELTQQSIARTVRKLRKEYDAIRAIDYFPGDLSSHVESVWTDFLRTTEAVMSPGEPISTKGNIIQLDPNAYQQRTWATRRHLWVDRVASAWLIQRFIDRHPRFVWLDTPADCPPGALGFDFEGAAFTHAGELVTFEVLMASFGLDQDRGLRHLGAMIHVLDVGGPPVPEANGFEAILAGARQRITDDDQLLEEFGKVLDSLYTHFSNQS